MNGKEKCKALKEIRREIAKNNNIEYFVEECQHKGDCKGTCPKCEAEVRYLEKELAKQRTLGQRVAVAGVAAGLAASFSACSPGISNIIPTNQVDGDIGYDGGLEAIEYVVEGEVAEDDYSNYDDEDIEDENIDLEDENSEDGNDSEEGSEDKSDEADSEGNEDSDTEEE